MENKLKENLVAKIKAAESKYYKESPCMHCGPGNGCDDCRGCKDAKKDFELSKIRRAAYDEYKQTFGVSYQQDFDYDQIVKKEEEYNKWVDHCRKCGGNFDDDCRDCKDWDEKFKLSNSLKWLKEEYKRKYGVDYDMNKSNKQSNKEVKNCLGNEKTKEKEIQDKDNKIKELESKLQESENKYKYLLADLENIKKRYNKQLEDKTKYEGELILKNLLSIYDNIEMASKYNNEKSIVGKVNYDMTRKQLLELLNTYGVELIYKEERPAYFNPEYDEAIFSQVCDDKTLDNSIVNVYQKGFFFKDKILRYEKVIVNKYED